MTATLKLVLLVLMVHRQGASMSPFRDLLLESPSQSDKPSPYELALKGILLPNGVERKCVFVVNPSLSAEWSVYLARDPSGARVVVRALRKPLSDESVAQKRSTRSDVKFVPLPGEVDPAAVAVAARFVRQSEASVSQDLALELEGLCGRALALARALTPSDLEQLAAMADGVTFHVSQCSPHGCVAATTWSPERSSLAAQVVELAETMRRFALAAGPQRNEMALRSAAASLAEAISKQDHR